MCCQNEVRNLGLYGEVSASSYHILQRFDNVHADDNVHISNGVTSDEAMRSQTLYNKFEGCSLIRSTVNTCIPTCRPYLKNQTYNVFMGAHKWP